MIQPRQRLVDPTAGGSCYTSKLPVVRLMSPITCRRRGEGIVGGSLLQSFAQFHRRSLMLRQIVEQHVQASTGD